MRKQDIAKKYNVLEEDLMYRNDGRIEWICKHGIGHTLYNPDNFGVHGCDGCCNKIKEAKNG